MRAQDNKGLTNNERAQLRGEVSAYMAEHPARAPLLIQGIDWIDTTAARTSDFFLHTRTRFAFSAALLLLVVGGGTSYAAEAALPGDALYAVKVGINEKVAGALAVSPEAHVRFDAQLAERRLQEAEVLAASGRFSAQDREQLEFHLNVTTADFNSYLVALATSSESGAIAAANAQSDMEATFTAHAQVLAAISSAIPDTSHAVAPFEAAVNTHISAARKAREKLDDQRAASSSMPLATTVQTSSEDAIEASHIMQALIPQTKASLGASTSALVARRASDVAQSVADGQAHARNGNYEKALGAFQVAIRAAQQMRAEVSASEQLKRVIPSSPLSASAISVDADDERLHLMTTDATSTTLEIDVATDTGEVE